MSRPKFSTRIQCWVPDAIAQAFESLAADGMLKPSDHIRLALSNHLRSLGITTTTAASPRPAQPNGHHRQEQARNA
jgi:hypothetical protein